MKTVRSRSVSARPLQVRHFCVNTLLPSLLQYCFCTGREADFCE